MERDKLQTYCKKWCNTIKNMTAPENPHNIANESTLRGTWYVILFLLLYPLIIAFIIVVILYIIPAIGRLTSAMLGKVPFSTTCNTTKYCCEIPSIECAGYGLSTILITLLGAFIIGLTINAIVKFKKSYDYAAKMVETTDYKVQNS